MADITRIIFGTGVLVALVVSASLFFTDFNTKNLPASNDYLVLSNSTTHFTELTNELDNLRIAADSITGQETNFGGIAVNLFTGTLSFLKIPVTVAQIAASLMTEAAVLLGIPIQIVNIVTGLIIVMALVGLVAVVSKTQL